MFIDSLCFFRWLSKWVWEILLRIRTTPLACQEPPCHSWKFPNTLDCRKLKLNASISAPCNLSFYNINFTIQWEFSIKVHHGHVCCDSLKIVKKEINRVSF